MSQTRDVVFLCAVRNTRPVAQCHDAPSEIATAPGPSRPGRSRKHAQVLDTIYQAAIEEFASEGLAGATTQAIADKAGLSKAQLYYYIESKEALYRQVLKDIVNDMVGVFIFSGEDFGPREVLTGLIRRKMLFSFEHPLRSRILAAEVMRGAPVLKTMTDTSRQCIHRATLMIQDWINRGLMDQADPMLFLFHLCAVTQFYADHVAQVAHFRSVPQSDEEDRRYLVEQVTQFLLKAAGAR
ncbi:TetR family transcriptional regulator C-terminal domain-containing protein [Variovorax sp. LjRoot84]